MLSIVWIGVGEEAAGDRCDESISNLAHLAITIDQTGSMKAHRPDARLRSEPHLRH